MRNITEVVGSHTASIQKLEMQMRDFSREKNPKQKGQLPSDTIVNPKNGGSGSTSHVMAITTRSGKVLQGDIEQEVVGEEAEQEVEAEEQGVVEVERVPEKEKVQEVNQEGVKEKDKETSKAPPPIPRPPPPFPQRLIRRVDDRKLEKFYDILKQLSVNIPFLEAFQEMLGFAKYLKVLITKKRTTKKEVVNMTHRVSSIIATSPVQKKEDPGAFTIPCTIGERDFAKALCDNGASINLMPLAIYKQAGLGMPRPTSMRLQMADRSIKRPVGIVDDVIVKVGKFHLPADFVTLDCAIDKEIPIILGRPFLATGRALMDSERNEIKFRVNDEEVTFQASKGMKLPHEYESISVIYVVDEVEDAVELKMEEQCLGEALAAILVNFDGEDMDGYMESVNQLLEVLKEHRQAIGWTIADIRGIPVGICEHKIQLESETKPNVEHQRRLNPSMQEFMGEPSTMCAKKGGMTVIENEKNELIPTRIVTGGRDFLEVFMDDFSVVGDSFEHCLNNLRQVLKRCEETNLVLNWEKFHFMVDEGIVLRHKISKHGIEVDRAKIEILPPPTFVKGVRSFLGHVGFYRRFIKDLSKIANPMCKLLEKDAMFVFDEKCLKSFEELKQRLTTTPIIVMPDWSLPFELMCNASGVAIGAMLGQRHNKVLHLVYYASKTLNGAQMNYTVTKQEFFAIVYAFEKFRAYLLGSKVVGYTDHAALRYLMANKDTKPRLIRWVFDLIPDGLESYQRKKFLRDCRQNYWEEPYLFRVYADNIIRRCVPEEEVMPILKACHDSPVGGHHGGNRTAAKVLECGYYWPFIYHDANQMVKA
uniref:RNA-directed DNA polymerase n=1 Tax=Nicotiana sylvestris TaxID=4096 RepID=A0A1U7XZP7_NICSY|nr:PREDICTED: uncharacterized protein LOC104241873 [Nicotiana sylvestris]